jgi:hypothetical protein
LDYSGPFLELAFEHRRALEDGRGAATSISKIDGSLCGAIGSRFPAGRQ